MTGEVTAKRADFVLNPNKEVVSMAPDKYRANHADKITEKC
jgi:peroxiredoxin